MKKYHSPKEFLDAAKSLDTSLDELRELAQAPYVFVQTAVANHPKADSELLLALMPQKLETWHEQERATILAQHPNTTVEILESLAGMLDSLLDNGREHHLAFKVGVLLCCNSRTPINAIIPLLSPEQSSMQFRKVVARETHRKELLEVLTLDRSEKVRLMAQKTIMTLLGSSESLLHS